LRSWTAGARDDMRALSNGRQLWLVCAVALTMTGCFFSERQDTATGNTGSHTGGGRGGPGSTPPPPAPPPPAVNRAPTISGSPTTSLRVGEAYAFQPSASDPDGDSLTFSIQNRPAWATFNVATGRLAGTPDNGDVGQFGSVRIAVSDGRAQAALNSFQIAVSQIALGSVTLSWTPPTTNADGTPMTNLAGYRIYYGRTSGTLDAVVEIGNTGSTRWVVDNLAPATWYFTMTSYNSAGVESTRSSVVSSNLT
jgi:putative Ig domain-containing protein